jgi:hypothetical protein
MDKVVLHFNGGSILKGRLLNFSPLKNRLSLKETSSKDKVGVDLQQLKAIFFVKSFKGDYKYKEQKAYTARKIYNKKIFVKFNDAESVVGYLDGLVPWDKGFFLSDKKMRTKGFSLFPADRGSNNSRIFVINSAVKAVTVVP